MNVDLANVTYLIAFHVRVSTSSSQIGRQYHEIPEVL